MRIKKFKQILAFALAGALAVSGAGVPTVTVSAGEIVALERTARGGSMENGMSYSATEMNTDFNGTNVFEANSEDVGLFRENIKGASSIDISITFKPASVSNFMNLLEISNSSKNSKSDSPAEELGLIVASNGTVYLMSGSVQGSTDWQTSSGVTITAGNTYTLTLSVSGNGLSFQMNGGDKKTISTDGTKNTKKFVQAFFGGSVEGYTDWRQNIDSVVIGGLKEGSYQTHNNFKNFNGEITSVTIAGKNSTETPVGSGVTSIMFNADSLDNTWLFGGGVETQGRYEEIGGVRNFIGQFEEYVRWEKRVNGVLQGMQRYTINAGKEGQNAVQFAENLSALIQKTEPMAVSYLIGPEDYNSEEGTDAFKAALGEIIDKALAMKDESGCVVIQYPHAVKDEAVNTKIEAYRAAAQEVVNGRASSEKNRIAVVDHYEQTKTDDFKNSKLTEEGLLNGEGHYEIAKQFSQVVFGSTSGFPTISENWTAEEAPDTYLDMMPAVTASADSLKVAVDGVEGTEWRYILTIDGTEICGTASGNPFTIEKLPENAEYELIVQTGDGTAQLSAVAGTVTEGNQAQAPKLTEMQQAIRDKAENTEGSLTWLFMGDSITHAAAHTHGYDGIAQIFEKYLKEDLGRTDDIVVNTAVSGATAERTIENIEQRMTKYKPDIVSIMLGTNDTISTTLYNENLKSIVAKIREVNPNALIIFRSPTPAKSGAYATKPAGENGSVAQMKKVAEECGNILFIDQYTEWNKETTAYPYLFTSQYYYGDNNIHPGAAGQLRMVQQFIEECGLNTNTEIANLSYEFAYTEETSDVEPNVQISESNDGITVSKSELQEAYSTGNIGNMTVVLTDRDGRSYTKSSGLDGNEVTMSLPTSRNYTVKVIADIKGNTAKHVTFAEKNILLTPGTEKVKLEVELAMCRELYNSSMNSYTEASVKVFRAAYEAAKKAIDNNETDIEQLDRLTEALKKSEAALTWKTTITGAQTVTISDSTVTVPAGALYTASDVTWSSDKSSAVFTLTANADTRFDSAVQVTVSNAEALRLDEVHAVVKGNQITVTLTVKKASSSSDNHQGQTNRPQEPEAIKQGMTYAVGQYRYKVTSTTEMTAEVVGFEKADSSKKVTIYDSVKLGGKSYTVTAVGANAFKGNKKITSVVVKKNVKTIGKNAFAGCTGLKKVTINSTKLTTINAKAFFGCKSLKTITIKSKVLKKVGKNVFKGIHKKAVIKVPKAKRTAYANKVLKNKGQAKTVKIK